MQKHDMSPEVAPTPTSSALVTYILLAIIIVQGFFNIYLLTGNSVTLPASTGIDALGVKKALLELEYDKVGGKEHYEMIAKATLIQIKDQTMPQVKEFLETQGWTQAATTPSPEPIITETLTPEQVQKVISNAVLEGNAQADIVAIEYSDMECPFCIRQYAETKLRESLVTQYWDKVAFAFKNNRGVNHQGTEAKAIGALCAKKVGGNEAYAKFYHAVMDGTTQSIVFPVANLGEAAKSAWVDIAKWQSCYDNKETASEFLAETQEAGQFGLRWTPGTLILNVKTGKYTTVEGAYPLANFVQKIDSLMN